MHPNREFQTNPSLMMQIKMSTRHGLASFKNIYNVLGFLVATVSVINFLHVLIDFPLSLLIRHTLSTYKAIVYGAIDWVTFPFSIILPPLVKDLIFIYTAIGGGFMRARSAEGMYNSRDDGLSLKGAIAKYFLEREHRHFATIYRHSPVALRRIYDLVLWPRVARQYYTSPVVFRNEYLGTSPSFKRGYKPGPRKYYEYDRGIVFLVHFSSLAFAVALTIVVNAFLSLPE